ncbi:MAG: DUF2905 domain-containing protein [Aquificaceae bacterium]
MEQFGKLLLLTGFVLVVLGILMMVFPRLPLGIGKLPGDIVIKKDNFILYFPIVTSILFSLILTLLVNLFFKK